MQIQQRLIEIKDSVKTNITGKHILSFIFVIAILTISGVALIYLNNTGDTIDNLLDKEGPLRKEQRELTNDINYLIGEKDKKQERYHEIDTMLNQINIEKIKDKGSIKKYNAPLSKTSAN